MLKCVSSSSRAKNPLPCVVMYAFTLLSPPTLWAPPFPGYPCPRPFLANDPPPSPPMAHTEWLSQKEDRHTRWQEKCKEVYGALVSLVPSQLPQNGRMAAAVRGKQSLGTRLCSSRQTPGCVLQLQATPTSHGFTYTTDRDRRLDSRCL